MRVFSHRSAIAKYTIVIALIIGLVIGGVAGWFSKPVEMITETVTGTVTKTVTAPITPTPTPTPSPTPTPTPTPTPKFKETLVIAMAAEPMTLDPAVSYDPWSQTYLLGAYDGLVRYKAGSVDIEPNLATRWEWNEDATIWTFYLRDDVDFHDGTHFNAEAVKTHFERLLNINKGPAWMYGGIDHIEVADEYTVKFFLTDSDAMFIQKIASMYGPLIISPKAYEEHKTEDDPYAEIWFTENMVGTGPYKFVEWVHGQQVVLEKFEDYWRGWTGPHVERVIVKFVEEPSTQKLLLEAGDIDIATNLPIEVLDTIGEVPGIKVIEEKNTLNIIYIILNCQKEPTKNLKVRQAISYAFDYESIVKDVFRGHAVQLQGPLPNIQWGHNDTLPIYHRDVEKAKQLLAEAGYPDGFEMEYAYYSEGGEWFRMIGETFQSNMAEIGITVTLRPMVLDPFVAMAANPDPMKKTHAFSTDWYPDFAEPSNWLGSFFLSDAVFLSPAYQNPEYDEVLYGAMTTLDHEEAVRLYQRAQSILVRDAPALWVVNQNYMVAMRENVMGFKYRPAAGMLIFPYDIYIPEE